MEEVHSDECQPGIKYSFNKSLSREIIILLIGSNFLNIYDRLLSIIPIRFKISPSKSALSPGNYF